MTTAFDTSIANKVFDVVDTYGKTIAFEEVSNSYSPATGINTETPTTHNHKVSPPDRFEQRFVDNDLIRAQDLMFLLPAKGITFTPTLGMQVTIDSVVYDTTSIRPIYSGDDIAAYEYGVRS